MADWDAVRRLVLGLPEVIEDTSRDGLPSWRIRSRTFAWERPLRRGDLVALGPAAPDGPVLAVRVADVGVKEALLAQPDSSEAACFTTPHFDGYPAVLVEVDRIGTAELGELLTEAWLATAPKRLAAAFVRDQAASGRRAAGPASRAD